MGVIEARGLTKRFGTRTAVDGLDLDVAAGSITGFLGLNGAGKTTTIRMLVGLVAPTSGEARVCGVSVRERRHGTSPFGAIVETPAFYGELSARDNLRVLALTDGRSRTEPELAALLARVGLAGREKDPVRGFSMGMRQRLGVAAALLGDPKVLFLDEPTNGLDPQGQLEMRQLLASLPAEGRTVFVSSHLLRDVELTCTDLVIIHQGKKLVQGKTSELLAHASVVRLRLDDCAKGLGVLQRERPALECVAKDGRLEVKATSAEAADPLAADLVRVLVNGGLAVHEVQHARDGLEQYFLELTKGEPS